MTLTSTSSFEGVWFVAHVTDALVSSHKVLTLAVGADSTCGAALVNICTHNYIMAFTDIYTIDTYNTTRDHTLKYELSCVSRELVVTALCASCGHLYRFTLMLTLRYPPVQSYCALIGWQLIWQVCLATWAL